MSHDAPTEDRPIRTLAAALALTLLLPASALAQDSSEGSSWPSADELRRELQGIGYEFVYDGNGRASAPEWRSDLPGLWSLSEPAVVDDAMPVDMQYEAFTLQLVDIEGQPVQLLFGATSIDEADGELDTMATVLMEVASRLPDGNGLDAAVWYMSNIWLRAHGGQVTDLPCLVEEFDGGAMVVWRGGDGERLESFLGTIAHFDGTSEDVERCRALQAEVANTTTEPALVEDAAVVDSGIDYTVAPDEAVAMIKADERTVIDVRTPAEYEQAHVVGAVNIDVEAADFAERIAELDPEEPYLLYCRSGRRSNLAAQQMAAAGFTDIADAAGLADLARAGAPIE